MHALRSLVVALLLWGAIHPAVAQTSDLKPLKVIVGDAEFLFGGESLDADQLRAKLAATGRQSEKVQLQIGRNAKTVYIHKALDAIHAAGFGTISLVGPSGIEIPGAPPI